MVAYYNAADYTDGDRFWANRVSGGAAAAVPVYKTPSMKRSINTFVSGSGEGGYFTIPGARNSKGLIRQKGGLMTKAMWAAETEKHNDLMAEIEANLEKTAFLQLGNSTSSNATTAISSNTGSNTSSSTSSNTTTDIDLKKEMMEKAKKEADAAKTEALGIDL